jgi:hypothetical protein
MVYEQDANLLEGIGEAELTDEKIKLAEAFICKLCNQVTDTSDEARDLDWVAPSRGKTFWTLRFSKHLN